MAGRCVARDLQRWVLRVGVVSRVGSLGGGSGGALLGVGGKPSLLPGTPSCVRGVVTRPSDARRAPGSRRASRRQPSREQHTPPAQPTKTTPEPTLRKNRPTPIPLPTPPPHLARAPKHPSGGTLAERFGASIWCRGEFMAIGRLHPAGGVRFHYQRACRPLHRQLALAGKLQDHRSTP